MITGQFTVDCANCGHNIVEFWSVQNEWQEFSKAYLPTTKHGGVEKIDGQRYEVFGKGISARVTYNCRCARCGITEIDIDMSRVYRGV